MDDISQILLFLTLAGVFALYNLLPGCGKGTSRRKSIDLAQFLHIQDKYMTLDAVTDALRRSGLESCNLIVAVDFTHSNTWNGKESFQGRCLHHMSPDGELNPYQQALTVLGRTLASFDEDGLIPAFGFGDSVTRDAAVFPLNGTGEPCHLLGGVLEAYESTARSVRLSGPTSFVPAIEEAISIVQRTGQYHILVIIADGEVSDMRSNLDAIARASEHPLSIICVGVGDGPWEAMEEMDDNVPDRRFDNFQFVRFSVAVTRGDAAFALQALMEVPDQYAAIKAHGLLRPSTGPGIAKPKVTAVPPPDSPTDPPIDPGAGMVKRR